MKLPTRGTTVLAVAPWLLGVCALSGALIPVRFVSERIILSTHDGSFEVEGVYEYHNPAPWPTSTRLHIPIPADEQQLAPTWLTVEEVDLSGRCLRLMKPVVRQGESSVRFFFTPGQRRLLRLRFEQPITAPQARYLLLSTHEWDRAIVAASFELHLARGQRLVSSSYLLEPLPGGSTHRSFAFSVRDFWPLEDWIIRWTPQEAT